MFDVHQEDSEFDVLIDSTDGNGYADNARLTEGTAEAIRKAGYECEVALVGPPTGTAQPVGVYMRRADYEQWRQAKAEAQATRIYNRIIRVCNKYPDLRPHAEAVAQWAYESVIQAEAENPKGQHPWQEYYGRRVGDLDFPDIKRWLKNVPALQEA